MLTYPLLRNEKYFLYCETTYHLSGEVTQVFALSPTVVMLVPYLPKDIAYAIDRSLH